MGWDDQELWIEHRVVESDRLAALVAMRGVVRAGRTKVPIALVAREVWPGAASPALPEWIERLRVGDAACRAHAADMGDAAGPAAP